MIKGLNVVGGGVKSQKKLILILWLILTSFNINKAYHMDDAFHLEAATCIGENLMTPMSGEINWWSSPTPMYTHNQPPLFFYVMCLTQYFFGNSEVVMHLLLSCFSLLSLVFFCKIGRLLKAKYLNVLMVLFALCPSFIVNQNIMTDIPVLSISLGVLYYLLLGLTQKQLRFYVYSVLLLSVGLLIKYSLLPLIVVVFLSILFSKTPKKVVVLIIPFMILFLWTIWNLWEFDASHLIGRPRYAFHWSKILSFLGTLGSMSFFTFVYLYHSTSRFISKSIIYVGFLAYLLTIPLVYYGFISELLFQSVLNVVFICNGFLLLLLFSLKEIKTFREFSLSYLARLEFPLVLTVLGFSFFITVFAPFNATRHILLIIPFLLLCAHQLFEKTPHVIMYLCLFLTLQLGVLLGVSDWVYADFYRTAASQVNTRRNSTVWSVGHWGWQWYSRKQGMKTYDVKKEVNNGDLMVMPTNISGQRIAQNIELEQIDFITEEPNVLTFFSGKNFANMYNSFSDKPAWTLSNMPIDTVFIYRIHKKEKP